MKLYIITFLKTSSAWLYGLLIFSLLACISPFEPEINKYENLLVIDGAISDIPGSAYVRLSRTSPYNDRKKIPVNDAVIMLVDDNENQIQFTNPEPGYYLLPDSTFSGQIGRSYKINIETTDGVICESLFEELIEPIAIDDIKYEFIKGSTDEERGIEIQIDVINQDNREAYFAWEYTETWEFEVPYISPKAPNSSICYRKTRPPVFLIRSTQDLVKNELLNYPLYFIDNTTNRLHREYSVLITQHILSKQTYLFFEKLNKINEDQGSLFDNSPITIIGNMRNISYPDQPILGNFQVTGTSSKRIFINNDDVVKEFIPPSGFENCDIYYGGRKDRNSKVDSLLILAGWVIMDKEYSEIKKDTIFSLTSSTYCYDCKKSGTSIKPDFWIEE